MKEEEQSKFQHEIATMHAEVSNVGMHMGIDSTVRVMYTRRIHAMSAELQGLASGGRISWYEAAVRANQVRNEIMTWARSWSTPVGRSFARNLKSEGVGLTKILDKKAQSKFGLPFNQLAPSQRDGVCGDVVKSAGKSNPQVTARMQNFSYAGRSLVFLSMATSAYNILSADDHYGAARREAAIQGAGIFGGLGSGAMVGAAFAAGPATVTMGAFVGGAMAAYAASSYVTPHAMVG